MKKIAVLVVLLLSGFGFARASVVTPEEARRTAESFLASRVGTKASPVSLSLAWRLPSAKPGGADLIYAYENRTTGGYVIVSGEDAVGPVLGYSAVGRFPAVNMPDGLKYLMDYYADVINLSREKGWAAAPNETFDPSQIVRLKTAKWSQLAPYNAECPDIYGNGSLPPVGCVATAIGIIMNYHRWPVRGQGTLPSYSYTMWGTKYNIEGCALGHPYDWDAMNAENPDYGEIARLLHEIGVMTEMMYSGTGSGTVSSYVTRLSQYFGYDKAIKRHERDHTDDARFESYIRAEIDAKRPVLFSGYSTEEGHSMVIDGYCGRYFSINFGWGGQYSSNAGYSNPQNDGAWFLLTPVQGHEQDFTAYNFNQDIFCGIRPDAGGDAPLSGCISEARMSLPYDFAVGKPFTVLISVLSSLPADAYVVHTDANDNIKETISGKTHLDGNDDRIFGWTTIPVACTVSKAIEAGDRICVAMDSGGKRAYVEMPRQSVIIFQNDSPDSGLRVGYVTGNRINPDNEFLIQALRDGKSWNVREDWNDFFYFKCYKDLVWQIVNDQNGVVEWDSGELYDRDTAHGEIPRFTSLLQEDHFYNFIRLTPGDYTLRLRNPLTGAKLELSIVI